MRFQEMNHKKLSSMTENDTKSKRCRPEVSLKKGILKIWSKYTGEHPCLSVMTHFWMNPSIKAT